MKSAGICEMCGHHVAVRQKVHIKPKVFKALLEAGLKDLPESWKKSIYQQAAEASAVALGRKTATNEDPA